MLDKVLTPALITYMLVATEETEDDETMFVFSQFIRKTFPDVLPLRILADNWNSRSVEDKVKVSIELVGEKECSRFMLMMDYIVEKDLHKYE